MKKINPIIKIVIISLIFAATIVGALSIDNCMSVIVIIVGALIVYFLTFHWL